MGEFVVEDRGGVRRVPIGRQMTIGRGSDNSLVLRSAIASRRHAWVWQQRDRFIIEDLGSTNGTFVNGWRVPRIRFLNHNDVITIGDAQLTFVTRHDPSTSQTPPSGVPRSKASQIFCSRCGAPNYPNARFCEHCGQSLAAAAGFGRDWRSERVRSGRSITPTDPVVARPFPVTSVTPEPGGGRGVLVLLILLAIVAVILLTMVGVLVTLSLG